MEFNLKARFSFSGDISSKKDEINQFVSVISSQFLKNDESNKSTIDILKLFSSFRISIVDLLLSSFFKN
jgi:hypothetical protein